MLIWFIVAIKFPWDNFKVVKCHKIIYSTKPLPHLFKVYVNNDLLLYITVLMCVCMGNKKFYGTFKCVATSENAFIGI